MSSRLEKFFSLYQSKSTIGTYRYVLKEFFKSIYGKETNLEESAEKYFDEERNHEEDIRTFFASINDRPNKTVRLLLAGVKSFLMENDVELKQRFWKGLSRKIKGSRALTMDKVPSNVELRKILIHMPIQGKALYMTLSSSGMRIGETLQLKLDDLELDNDPPKVNIRGEYTKSGNPRIAFMTNETKEHILEWLKVREQYLKVSVARSVKRPQYKKEFKGKSLQDDRLFPFENNTAYAIWNNALTKTGNGQRDKTTNRRTLHPHVLRKFFRTKLGSVINVDVVEALMGHEGYLTEVYRRYSSEQLGEFYKQGESALLIFTEAGKVEKLRQEIKERNEQLQTVVNALNSENLRLKETLREVKANLKQRDMTQKEIQYVLKVFSKAPLGFVASGMPPKDTSEEEFQKWYEKEQEKFEKEMEKADKIMEKWEI